MADDIRQNMIRLLPRLRRFAYALSGDLDKADDLVQDTCVRALANLGQWQAGTRLDSWMYRIAQNLWFDRMRAQKSRGEVLDVDAIENICGCDGRKVTEGRLDLERVSRDISELPPDQQILIGLVCLDGLSYKEAAEALEIPIGTVMSRLSRARRTLSEALIPNVQSEADAVTTSSEGGHARSLR